MNPNHDAQGRFSEGDSVKIVGEVTGKGKSGTVHQVSPSGTHVGVADKNGNHLGYYHVSDLKKRNS